MRVELLVETAPEVRESLVLAPPPVTVVVEEHELDPLGGMPLDGTDDEGAATWASGTLNPRYTFDRFVIGASNRFAHAAALSVAENPARSYNPLFIYGPAGLGKTHLLHAIGNYVRTSPQAKRVRYVSTETFMNEFVDAIRTKHDAELPAALPRGRRPPGRRHPVPRAQPAAPGGVLPHLQLAARRAANQIVLSSDRPPKQIPRLEDRLRTRLEWGLITDVQPPEFETRLAILRMKAESERLEGSPTRSWPSSPATSATTSASSRAPSSGSPPTRA